MLYFILFLSFGYSVRVLSTLLHELGHAIPALLFTKEQVEIYLGGNIIGVNTKNFKFKRLLMHVNFTEIVCRGGLCVHKGLLSRFQHIVILFSGVSFTLIVALLSFSTFLLFIDNLYVQLFAFLLCISALIDVFYNLVPSSLPIKLADGSITFNDGYQIKNLLFRRSTNDALNYFNAKKYSEALQIFEHTDFKNNQSDSLYKIQAMCYFYLSLWDKLINWMNAHHDSMEFGENEYKVLIYAYLCQNRNEEAIETTRKSLQFFPDSENLNFYLVLALFNTKQYQNVIESCNLLTKKSEFDADLNALKGASLLEVDRFSEALEFLLISERKHQTTLVNLDKYLGIAYWENNIRIKAQYHFNKAYEIDSDDIDIFDYLDLVYKDLKLK